MFSSTLRLPFFNKSNVYSITSSLTNSSTCSLASQASATSS